MRDRVCIIVLRRRGIEILLAKEQRLLERAMMIKSKNQGELVRKIENRIAPISVQGPPVVLVLTRNGHLSKTTMEYGVNVAQRLNHRLLVAYVDTMPFLWDGGQRNHLFSSAVNDSVVALEKQAKIKGVLVTHVVETGKIGKVVHRLCRIIKNIGFIVVDRGIKKDELLSVAPVPVFYGTGGAK